METFLSAVLGELISRSINFIINKWSTPLKLNMEESLQRALLRAQVIIEEAMGRQITNQAMLLQLGMLRDAMHRGYYALDAFRYQPHYGEDGNDPAARQFMPLSKVPSAKDPYFSSRTIQFQEQLREALDRLSSMIVDLNELVMFLMSYPRLYRQPYSMHILLGNCMFGRQMEAELVINFLLHTKPHSSEELDVLPVVGPLRVGKSTLIAHVCKDERVCGYFSEILWLHNRDFMDGELTFRQGCAMNRRNCLSNLKKGKRLLVVIELYGNLCEDAWNRFYLASKQRFPSGSKIIVTSCSDKIVKFGTTPALTLEYMSLEAYWYFFKTLTFGSMDPETHPRFAQMAMEIARLQNRSINCAYITSYLLRDNFNIHFWCKVLIFLRGFIQKHISKFGVHPFDLLNQNKPVLHGRMASPSEDFMICHQYHRFPDEEVPEIRVQDVLYGSIKKHGKFEVLAWRSQIPPYYSYVNACEIRERKITGAKRKHCMKDGATFC
ncbi:putative disease resistance RPP13-like protein 1 [Miscanthus floridulus]|uniref:putative disease resistance RPP13-like protein 1 n=1 Tax=Miscanthus floridulus TaxID=154761 RepID=UPI0034583B3D